MQLWLILALAAALFFSFVGILQRVFALKSIDKRAFGFLYLIFASLWTSILLLKNTTEIKLFFIPSFFAAILFYGIWDRWRFTIASKIPASIMILLSATVILIPSILGIIFLKESPTFYSIIGISLIIFSFFVLSIPILHKKTVKLKNFIVALILNSFLGLAVFFDKVNLKHYQPEFYALLTWFIPSIFVYFPNIQLEILKKELFLNWKNLLLLSFIQSLAYFFAVSSLKIAPVFKVAPIINLNLILGIIIAIPFLKETQNTKIKLLAALLALTGAILLNK